MRLTKEDSTSELLGAFYDLIKDRAEGLIEYTDSKQLGGYDDDILAIYFILKSGGYND